MTLSVNENRGPIANTRATYADAQSRRIRGRLAKQLLSLAMVGVVFCGIIVWQRDLRHIEAAQAQLVPYIAPLRQFLQENGTLPVIYPNYPDQNVSARTPEFAYVQQEVIRWAQDANQPVVIGYGAGRSLIGRNGRAVAIFDEGRLRTDWMNNKELGQVLQSHRAIVQAGRDELTSPG